MEKELIAKILIEKLLSDNSEREYLVPAIKSLSDSVAASPSDIQFLQLLSAEDGSELQQLSSHYYEKLRLAALKFNKTRKDPYRQASELNNHLQGLPLNCRHGFPINREKLSAIHKLMELSVDYYFLNQKNDSLSSVKSAIRDELNRKIENLNLNQISFSFIEKNISALRNNATQMSSAHSELIKSIEGVFRQALNRESTKVNELSAYDDLSDLNVHLETLFDELLKRFNSSNDEKEKQLLLDNLCAIADSSRFNQLYEIIKTPWEKTRASLIFTMRFGIEANKSWMDWVYWNRRFRADFIRVQDSFISESTEKYPAIFLLTINEESGILTASQKKLLESIAVEESAKMVSTEDFIKRWKSILSDDELHLLRNGETKGSTISGIVKEIDQAPPKTIVYPPPLPIAKTAIHTQPRTTPSRDISIAAEHKEKIPPAKPAKPPEPTIWDKHLFPFIAENWAILTGILMTIIGGSTLAFLKWNQHWLWRYTMIPVMLCALTSGLSWLAAWLEKRDPELKTTGTILRGAAVALLPINFMTVALLSNDVEISLGVRSVLVPVITLLYIIWAGWGLRKWCTAISGKIGNILAVSLLMINGLVMLGPIAVASGKVDLVSLYKIVGTGFYLGFLLVGGVIIYFTHKILTKEMLKNKRVLFFFILTLSVTYIQVFIWVHGFLHVLPQVYTYAPMIILAGLLLFIVEKRFLYLNSKSETHSAESFLGFALILLGVLMGFVNPLCRIFVLALAGTVWLYQAFSRKHPLHYWIALTFITMAGASIAMLRVFPGEKSPLIGLALAGAMSLGILISRKVKNSDLRRATCGMQHVLLILTAFVTVLCQWHYLTAPRFSAYCLLLIAGGFFWRAFRDNRLRWIHVAMMMLAMALPYLGCVDMLGKTLRGNKMVFGLAVLSILWLVVTALIKHPLIRKARSNVLVSYGAIAVSGMILRVLFEHDIPSDFLNKFLDYSGPLMITVTLIFAIYFTRSLIPAFFAFIIVIILFPELKAGFKETLELVGWGSGLGSACSSLALLAGCFYLREASFLKNLKDGDGITGKILFPLRRYDHTLFTWPLLAAALFMIIKTETFTFGRNIFHETVNVKVSIAIFISGLCWAVLGIYYRRFSLMRGASYIAWFWMFIGILCGYLHFSDAPYWSRPLLITMLLMQAIYLTNRYYLKNILEWTKKQIQDPTYYLLCALSPLITLVVIAALWFGEAPKEMIYIMTFVAIQLCWHELKLKKHLFSAFLFFLLLNTIISFTCPGNVLLVFRLDFYALLLPVTIFFLSPHAVSLLLERQDVLYQKIKSLILSFVYGSGVLIVLLGLTTLCMAFVSEQFTLLQLIVIFASLLVMARGQQSLMVYLILILNVYSYLNLRLTSPAVETISERVLFFMEPWRLGLLSLALAMSGIFGKYMIDKYKTIMCGFRPLPFFKSRHIGFIYIPAVIISSICVLTHLTNPEFRDSSIHIYGSFMAAFTLFLIARDWRKPSLFPLATIAFILANIHLVRVFAGDWLISVGLSNIHIICLGLVLTLLECAIAKRLKPAKFAVTYLNRICLSIGALILSLLAINYSVKHNLAEISFYRFIISGLMAFIAGLSFRRAARNPDEKEIKYVDFFEAGYHVGLTVAIWCMVLLIPWFRTPSTVLWALAIPLLFFYLKSEYCKYCNNKFLARFRHTTATLCFMTLAIYLFRAPFHILLFPDEPVFFIFYHHSSFLVILLALILLRLHGLKGNFWYAFYGGFFLMVGTYFAVTFFPKLRPASYPYNSAFCAILLGHFFTALSHERSPLRTAIQSMAEINDELWHTLRRNWGICQVALAHAAVAWAVLHFSVNTYLLAPMIFGVCTLLTHHGIIKKSPTYLGIAVLELFLALHMDFLVPSYLPQDYVIWVLIAIWTAVSTSMFILDKSRKLKIYGYIATAFSALIMAHILILHHPWSNVGVCCFALMAILLAFTPRTETESSSFGEYLAVHTLLLTPVWLVFFAMRACVLLNKNVEFSLTGFAATTITIALCGTCCLLFKLYLLNQYQKSAIHPPFIFDQFLNYAGKWGLRIFTTGLYLAFIITVLIQVFHYMEPYSQLDLTLLCILYGGLTIAWYFNGALTKTMPPYYLTQLSFLGFFAIIRRQLMLTTNFWSYEYDVWASLTLSFILGGIKQFINLKPKEVRVPLLTSICLLPVIALVWVVIHRLGTNTAMVVVGLQSLMFTYIGKDDRESPYNVIAIAGFIAFAIMLFWTKLELKVVHAYVVPVGTGILILLQLFKRRINTETRNQVRCATLLAMLGTAGYYALINSNMPVAYIFVFCVLCILTMGVGSFLKIRLYLYLGFAGLMVDLAAVFYRIFLNLDAGRMTFVGSMLLLTGLFFVGGAVYYKANQEKINNIIDQWRNKLGAWE